jgi:hypothetical protein
MPAIMKPSAPTAKVPSASQYSGALLPGAPVGAGDEVEDVLMAFSQKVQTDFKVTSRLRFDEKNAASHLFIKAAVLQTLQILCLTSASC